MRWLLLSLFSNGGKEDQVSEGGGASQGGNKHRQVPQKSGLLKNLIFMGLVLMAKEVIIFQHLPTPTVTLLRIRKVSRRKDP